MANEDRDEALRRIEKARETGATILDLSKLKIDTLPPKIADLTNLHSLGLHDTQITDLSHIADLTNLHSLDLHDTQITDLSHIADLTNLQRLDLDNTQVTDLSHIAGLTNLHSLDLRRSQVTDLSPIAGLTNLQRLSLGNTQVTDLRLLLDLPRLTHPDVPEDGRGVYFSYTPACNDPAIAAAAEIEDNEDRLQTLLAHLRTLPPWPEPLPGDLPPRPTNPDTLPAPEQDPTLPLIWGENGFDFLAAQVERDAISDAAIAELADLLEILRRKGNQHEDLHRPVLKAQHLLQGDPPDALKLHLQYQAMNRLRAGADNRVEKFDDETIAALDGLREIVPAITLGHPDVQKLIERQEADRRGAQVGTDPARERAVLNRMADEDSPFAPAVREAAMLAADPAAKDRLSGLRSILSRNGMIAVLQLGIGGVIGGATYDALIWAIQNPETLTSLALSMGVDVYWWARATLDRIKALLEARSPGP